METGNYPAPFSPLPSLLESRSWAPELGLVLPTLPAAEVLPAHTTAGVVELRDWSPEWQIGALGEGWPGECWRQHRAGGEPLTLTHSSGAALSPSLVIINSLLCSLCWMNQCIPKLRPWGVLLQQIKNRNPVPPCELEFPEEELTSFSHSWRTMCLEEDASPGAQRELLARAGQGANLLLDHAGVCSG